jgi:endonuclease/exonuclease/phosphatase family metal-dependent hydrolase
MQRSLRLVTWNCRSGSVASRLDELRVLAPDIVFLQECDPAPTSRAAGVVCSRAMRTRKAIALCAASRGCRCTARPLLAGSGRAAVAATVLRPMRFTAIGVWAQATHYADDVIRTLRAHASLLRDAPAVVFGDFNSGTSLMRFGSSSRHHQHLVDEFDALGLVSAYHAFHGVGHGYEGDATYFHQFNARKPWHIDFCFVPRAWAASLVNVAVIDGEEWRTRSDHLPLLVDLRVARRPRQRARSRPAAPVSAAGAMASSAARAASRTRQ